MLVIDVTKGIQTQTAECMVIGEITRKPILVALNKIDLILSNKRDLTVEKVSHTIIFKIVIFEGNSILISIFLTQ